MKQRKNHPLILVSPGVAQRGVEFSDLSVSLSNAYCSALIGVGAIPVLLAPTTSRNVIAASVAAADGVLLSGGDDINPKLYVDELAPELAAAVGTSPDQGQRDLRELLLVDEVFRQRKPILAICRGHQMLNVALGGTLLADIPQQVPGAINHQQMDRRGEVVHRVRLTEESLVAKIVSTQRLGVNSTHHQGVGQVAEPLTATGTSPDGVIEALELKPSMRQMVPFLLSVQFHPERLADRHKEHRRIFQAFARACALK
jgi:putative glutamine amidotransferase